MAKGTYRPDEGPGVTGGDRDASFLIPPSSVTIRGGYRGGSGSDACDLVAEETILSGEIGNATINDNSRHIVQAMSDVALLEKAFRLERVTVENGFCDESGSHAACGGLSPPIGGAGLRVRNRTFHVRECVFRDHHSAGGSAIQALCALDDSTISLSTFHSNRASHPWSGSPPALPCEGTPPSAIGGSGNGGAVWFFNSTVRVDACLFRCNFAAHVGGGLQMQGGGSPVISNCAFLGNFARDWGGGIRSGFDTYTTIVNCTVAGNLCANQGGGIAIKRADSGVNEGEVHLVNCIIWNNGLVGMDSPDDPHDGLQVWVEGADPGQVTLRSCDIGSMLDPPPFTWLNDVAWSGEAPEQADVVEADPMFVLSPASFSGWGAPAGVDIRLVHDASEKSPCVDAGVHAGFSPGIPDDRCNLDGDSDFGPSGERMSRDLGGVHRFGRASLDLGAHESHFCAADLNGDDTVGNHDLAMLLGSWSPPGGTCPDPCFADLVNDNVVDSSDLVLLLGAWGSCGAYGFADAPQDAASGVTPAEAAESLGFGSIAELIEWLGSLGTEAMFAWMESVFGDGT